MVEVVERAVEAAWKIKNLKDYDQRLMRAARRVDDLAREHETAALVIYEAALMKSGHSQDEVRALISSFRETFEDEEEPFTIPRVSGVMNVHGDEWFFGDAALRTMTGQLLGQFQHRVAQYNYIDEAEVLKRWANSYDTRLFIRRGIYETEPVAGVVVGFDLTLLQYLRVAAGGDTLIPNEAVGRALASLGFDDAASEYEVLANAESLALHLDLPAPIAGAMLEDLAHENFTDYPAPPPDVTNDEDSAGETPEQATVAPGPEDQAAREAVREDPAKGEEPTRVQDPQAKDAPGVAEESGEGKPAAPESGRGGEPGTQGAKNSVT